MLLTSYVAHLTLTGARPDTIRSRRGVLAAFQSTLEPRQLRDATRLDVEAYLSRPLAPASRRAYRSALKAFYGWACHEEYLTHDPTEKVPTIRVPKGVPRPISEDDLHLALSAADNRMRSWLLLMALAGLRCMEVAGLEPRDIMQTPSGPLLHLRITKGGSPATVPLHPAVVEALAALPVRNGVWWTINPRTLSQQVNRHLRTAGVRGTAHALRHTAGTSFFRASGFDLLTTAALMRHSRIDTTSVYAALDPTRPAEVVGRVVLRAV